MREGGKEGVSMESMAEGTSVRQRDTIPGYEATRKKGMLTIIKKKWGKMVRSMHTENPSAEIRERERAFGKQEKGVSRRQRGGGKREGDGSPILLLETRRRYLRYSSSRRRSRKPRAPSKDQYSPGRMSSASSLLELKLSTWVLAFGEATEPREEKRGVSSASSLNGFSAQRNVTFFLRENKVLAMEESIHPSRVQAGEGHPD